MSNEWLSGVVRVLVSGKSQGTGFVVSDDGLIVTCAHVLGAFVPEHVDIVFQATNTQYEAQVLTKWYRSQETEDVAFLYIKEPLPESVHPLFLGSSSLSYGHTLLTFGYPEVGEVEGYLGYGVILGGGSKTKEGYALLQLRSSEITRGFSGAPLLDELRQRVVGMIVLITTSDADGKLRETAFATPVETLREICFTLRVNDICPYKGLAPFTETDSDIFFGREHYIADLIERLRRDRRLLAILGPTGSGKTSVVQAGLIPQLRQGQIPRSDRWEVLIFQPTDHPFGQFATQGLLQQGENLVAGIRAWLKEHPEKERLVLVLDQFEEVFTISDDLLRHHFITALTALVETDLATIIILMSDAFYSYAAQHAELMKLIERQLSNIPPMTYNNIMDAIQEPAKIEGLKIGRDLAVTMTNDTINTSTDLVTSRRKRNSSVLPLLSFLLQQMWEKRQDNELTFETFTVLGGISGSLTQWATKTYYTLNENQQMLARRIFTDLVFLGDDSDGRLDSRRQRMLSELSRRDEEKEWVNEVVQVLVKAHLLETSLDDERQDVSVNIIHDVLLREWELLKGWLHQDHRFLTWQYEVEKRSRTWVMGDVEDPQQRDRGLLLRGQELHEAETWIKERSGNIAQEEQYFIKRSLQLRLEEEMRKRQYEDIQRQQHMAMARQLATQALRLQEQQPGMIECSVLLAVEAMRRFPCREADQALRRGLALLPFHLVHILRGQSFTAVTFSPDGQDVAGAGEENAVWMRYVHYYSQHILPKYVGTTYDIAFSPDGMYLLTAGKGGTAWLVDTFLDHKLVGLRHQSCVRAVAWNPWDVSLVATASDDGSVGIWQVPRGHLLYQLQHDKEVYAVSFSHNGVFLVTAGADSTARVWDVSSGKQLALFPHEGPVTAIAFSPDDMLLATACHNGTVTVWKREQERRWRKTRPTPLLTISHRETVNDIAFSSNGRLLATASDDATAKIWNIDENKEVTRLMHDGPVKMIRFHHDSTTIATASADHTARVWNAYTGAPLHYLPHRSHVHAVAFNSHKPYIATASHQEGIQIWQTGHSSEIVRLNHSGTVKALRFGTRKNKFLVQALVEDKTSIQVWEVTEGGNSSLTASYQDSNISRLTFAFSGKEVALHKSSAIIFSYDGVWLAIANEDGTVEVLETATRRVYASLPHNGSVHCLAFSPNGQYLAVADSEHHLLVWEWQIGNTSLPVSFSDVDFVYTITFSPDNDTLIVGTHDHIVHAWRWKINENRQTLVLHHSGRIHTMLCSPNGEYLLTVSQENGVRVWDISTGLLISSMPHSEVVLAARFSSSGMYVITGSRDHTAGIWETTTGRQLACIDHEKSVYAVACSDDERYVATACEDQSIRLWIWTPEDLISEAATHLTRNLTQEEWHTYVGNEPYRRTYPNLGWREVGVRDTD